jgi:hypothetical protein
MFSAASIQEAANKPPTALPYGPDSEVGSPAYLDRAAPDFAPAKFVFLAFSTGPLIELDCGSNCPGRIVGPGRSAVAWRFFIFFAAFAFARWRALALVMGSLPFRVAGGSLAVSWPDVLIGDPVDHLKRK